MNNTLKLQINHILCHLLLIPGLIYGDLWMWIAGFFWWQVIAIVAISGGYHRYYSHKSFSARLWYDYCVNILGLFSGAGPAMTWAAAHRQHHAYSDTEDDPHSYSQKGWFAVYCNTWGYKFKIKKRYIIRLMRDPILNFFYRNYFLLNILLIGFLAAIDPLLLIFAYALPVVLAFHGYGLLNILGHRHGMPNNSWIANILTAGEGWHHNHHMRAGSHEIGYGWRQFDPTKWFIRLIRL